MKKLIFVVLSALFCFSGCETVRMDTFEGALVGTAVGAGTGALVGATIKNGDVGKSALLGAGIGLPVGIATSLVTHALYQQTVVKDADEQIEENQRHIFETQRELERIRERQKTEIMAKSPDPSTEQILYLGSSLGNPYL